MLPELFEASVGERFARKVSLLARLVGRKVPWIGTQYAAVELDDASRDRIEKGSIMGDEDRARHLHQELLEALDAADVEMIGGLIQQQELRLQRECECQRRALALATGAHVWRLIGLEIKALQILRQARLPAPKFALVVGVRVRRPALQVRHGARARL